MANAFLERTNKRDPYFLPAELDPFEQLSNREMISHPRRTRLT